MFETSTLLTVGHALDRAMEEGLTVRLNVHGEWISGRVVNHDGHGVALLEANGDICVLRPTSIEGIRVPAAHEGQKARAHGGSDPRTEAPRPSMTMRRREFAV